jgi:hypothetical protein
VDALEVLGMMLGIFNIEISIFKPGCGFPDLSFTVEVYATLGCFVVVASGFLVLCSFRIPLLWMVRWLHALYTTRVQRKLPELPACLRRRRGERHSRKPKINGEFAGSNAYESAVSSTRALSGPLPPPPAPPAPPVPDEDIPILGQRRTRTANKKALWTRNVLRAATLHFFEDHSSGEDDHNSKIVDDTEGIGDNIDNNSNDDTSNKRKDSDKVSTKNQAFIINSDMDNSNNNINNDSNENNDNNESNDSKNNYDYNNNSNNDCSSSNNNNSSSNDDDDNRDNSNDSANVTRTSGHVARKAMANGTLLSAEYKKPTLHFQKGVDADTSSVMASRQALSFVAHLSPSQSVAAISTTTTTTAATTTVSTSSISSKNKARRSLRNATSAAEHAISDSGGER